MYVDDQGQLKNLPVNRRATEIAVRARAARRIRRATHDASGCTPALVRQTAAGLPTTIHGDAFLARTVDCDEEFSRLDFTAAEVDSGAAWLEEARESNRRRQASAGKMQELTRGMANVGAGAEAMDEAAEDAQQKAVAGALYTWSQEGEDVTVEVRVPAETKGAHVKFAVKPQSIELAVATLPEGQRTVLAGTLFQQVVPDECNWTIANVDGGRVLQVTLTKKQPMRWLGVLR